MAYITSKYTLADFLTEAGAVDLPPIASKLKMAFPDFNKDLKWWPHQAIELNQALRLQRYGLLGEPGVGKTVPAQALLLYYVGYGNKALCLMPPVLIQQFKESLRDTFVGVYDHLTLHVLDEGPRERLALFEKWDQEGWPDVLCMSYQMFINYPYAMEEQLIPSEVIGDPSIKRKLRKRLGPETYRTLYQCKQYNIIIGDEAQALKKPSSMFHKAVAFLAGMPMDRTELGDTALLLMTGTPLHNQPLDAYGLIKLLRPWQYKSLKAFQNLHCVYAQSESGFERLIGHQNLDLLTINLYASAHRVTKNEVFSLQPPHIQEVPVTLSRDHMALYRKLTKERFLEKDGEIIDALSQQSLRQKCLRIITTPHLFTNDKFENNVVLAVDALLDSVGVENEKVILFSYFTETVEFMAARYKQFNPAVVYGKSNTTKEVHKFKTDPTCRIMSANPLSGGVGLNLQEVCGYAIFIEPLSVPGDFKQAGERIWRPGQTRAVHIWIIKALGTIAPKLTLSMLGKEDLSKRVNLDNVSLLEELLGEAA